MKYALIINQIWNETKFKEYVFCFSSYFIIFFSNIFFLLRNIYSFTFMQYTQFCFERWFFSQRIFLFIMYIFFFHNLHYRRNNSKGDILTSSVLPCWKNSVYQNTFVKSEEASTYQELDLSDSAYQNTEIPWQSFIKTKRKALLKEQPKNVLIQWFV